MYIQLITTKTVNTVRLIKLSEFRTKFFSQGSAPAKDTLIRQIENQHLKGQRIGNQYFIDIDEFVAPKFSELLQH